jgi:hypothetical protein
MEPRQTVNAHSRQSLKEAGTLHDLTLPPATTPDKAHSQQQQQNQTNAHRATGLPATTLTQTVILYKINKKGIPPFQPLGEP